MSPQGQPPGGGLNLFENIAALDIGSSTIKLLTLKTGFKNFQVTSMSCEDIVPDGNDNPAAVMSALTKILNENSLKGHLVLSNLPMERTVIRNITFPFNDVEKIASAIPFEAEENIPFKIDDLVMEFQSLKSPNPEEGRIMLAAVHKEMVRESLKAFQELGIQPARLGLESEAIFQCYKYFNQIPDESVIQLDIGHSKSILNIIRNNHLSFSRCIPAGVRSIHEAIASMNRISLEDARKLFENLNLDLTSIENNYQRELYKSLNLNKPRLKKIYETAIEIFEGLIEQVILSIKSYNADFGETEFNRILISGGGSNIPGIGYLLSRNLDLPVVALPFLQGYSELKIQTQFPMVFGTALSYLDNRRTSTNFLKGEFLPDLAGSSKKIYYLAATFGILSAFILLVNLGVSSYLNYKASTRFNETLNERYLKYFHTRPSSSDIIKSAAKIVSDEKKELGNIDLILQSNENTVDLLKDILTFFPKDSGFQLSNLVINESVVRIDGLVSTSRVIDDFKNRLIESKKYESVNLNTNINRKNEITFSMVIKQKTTGGIKKVTAGVSE